MTQNQDLRSRLTIGRKRDGRHECDESALQDLVELCLRPGVSGARMCQQRFQTDAPGSSFFASHLDAWNLVRANQAEIAACSKPRSRGQEKGEQRCTITIWLDRLVRG